MNSNNIKTRGQMSKVQHVNNTADFFFGPILMSQIIIWMVKLWAI